jgi:hypothetical protein
MDIKVVVGEAKPDHGAVRRLAIELAHLLLKGATAPRLANIGGWREEGGSNALAYETPAVKKESFTLSDPDLPSLVKQPIRLLHQVDGGNAP